WLPLAQIAIALLVRILIVVRFRQPLWAALLHALSQVMLMLIALNSFRLTVFGSGPQWKGRSYSSSGLQGES
ncbi:MAG TPA: glycosyl hydrolase, partial [Chlorobaculum parvum]|nr:glycosyl hydrolase [Chlorobaculum parvum]